MSIPSFKPCIYDEWDDGPGLGRDLKKTGREQNMHFIFILSIWLNNMNFQYSFANIFVLAHYYFIQWHLKEHDKFRKKTKSTVSVCAKLAGQTPPPLCKFNGQKYPQGTPLQGAERRPLGRNVSPYCEHWQPANKGKT